MRTVHSALLISVLLLSGCASAGVDSPAASSDREASTEAVRSAETAFARSFALRDRQGFASFLASDATFLGPNRSLHGTAEIMEVWGGMLEAPKAPFSWAPERVEANGDGSLVLSTGPVRDPEGKQIGAYASVWQRQSDGSWKVLFDGPGCPRQ